MMEQDRYRMQFWAAFDAFVPGVAWRFAHERVTLAVPDVDRHAQLHVSVSNPDPGAWSVWQLGSIGWELRCGVNIRL